MDKYEVNELEEYEEKKPERVKAEEYLVEYDDYDIVIGLLTAAQDADHDNRERAREAHLFVDKRDGQWEQQWWNANDGKPRYTFDMVNPILDQVTAEIEQSDFDVKVSPASGPASKEIAMIFDGLIRNVETAEPRTSTSTPVAAQPLLASIAGWCRTDTLIAHRLTWTW
jgi:hypothetical protein